MTLRSRQRDTNRSSIFNVEPPTRTEVCVASIFPEESRVHFYSAAFSCCSFCLYFYAALSCQFISTQHCLSMNLEELSTNVTSMPCFRGSTSSEVHICAEKWRFFAINSCACSLWLDALKVLRTNLMMIQRTLLPRNILRWLLLMTTCLTPTTLNRYSYW